MANNINISGRLHSVATDNIITGANEILDDNLGKKQDVINAELLDAIGTVERDQIIAVSSWDDDSYDEVPTK